MQFQYFVDAVLRTAYRTYKLKAHKKNYFVSGDPTGKWYFRPRLPKDRPVLWMDVFSGGEATQIVTLCRQLKERFPKLFLLLTTNNQYAADFTRKNNPCIDLIWDSPWDLEAVGNRFLAKINPKAVVFVENCSLPVIARLARRLGISSILISGLVDERFKEHPIYVRPFRLGFEQGLDRLLLKSESDALYLRKKGVPPDRVRVVGNLKYDPTFVRISTDEKHSYRRKLGITDDIKLLVGGSLHPKEPELVMDAFQALKARSPQWRLAIVPRYETLIPNIVEELQMRELSYGWFSKLDPRPFTEDVLIVDGFGQLVKLYNIASLAVLGGSFYKRSSAGFSQNLIEPVLAGCPTFFGPYTCQFEDLALRLTEYYPGFRATGSSLLENIQGYLFNEPSLRPFEELTGEIEKSNAAAVREICEELRSLLSPILN